MPAFCNQASLSYNNTATCSNTVQGNISEPLNLSICTLSSSYCIDEAITFAVSIANNCSCPCSDLIIQNDLGAFGHSCGTLIPLDYIEGSLKCYCNGTPQNTAEIICTAPLKIGCFSIPAQGNALILYSARVNHYAPLNADARICCGIQLSAGCLAAPVTAECSIKAAEAAHLTISKSMCPCDIRCNEPVTWTLLIQNSGNAAVSAADNIIISDIFDPILEISEVRFNGDCWSSPSNYSYNSATGVFTTCAGQICVPSASYSQNMSTGIWTTTPGSSTITITGTLAGTPSGR